MNTFLSDVDPDRDERIPSGPRLAIDLGAGAPNQVGRTMRIEGEIDSQRDMLVDGEVTGTMTVRMHTLTIGPKAKVKAKIKAQNVVLVGNVEGNIEATERIELRSRCNLLGNVRSPRIVIENGDYIKGNVEVVRSGYGIPVARNYLRRVRNDSMIIAAP